MKSHTTSSATNHPASFQHTLHSALSWPHPPRGYFLRRMFPSRPPTWISTSTRLVAKNFLTIVILALAFVCQHASAEPMDHWTAVSNTGGLPWINDLIFANGEYWAVAPNGKVQHSSTGTSWSVVQTPTTQTLTSITHANGVYVATGYAMTILSSTNGTSWTIRQTNAASSAYSFDSVIFANGKFLTLSAQPGTAVVRTSPDGVTWTPGSMSGAAFYPWAVAGANGVFVAVGSADGTHTVQTSTDGLSWTRRTTSFTNRLQCVTFFKGLFIAGGTGSSPVLATSPDGITWTKVSNLTFPTADTEFWGIKVLNGRVFAYGDHGLLMSSTNGTTWVKHTTGTDDAISSVGYNGSSLYLNRTSENPTGGGTFVSDPWAPADTTTPPPPPPTTPGDPTAARIANLSSRAWVGTGDSQFIAGFVVSGNMPKKVLVRAVGPTLATLGVSGPLADPQLRVVNKSGADVAVNNDWSSNANAAEIVSASAKVGAFALPTGSKDAATIVTLSPGPYTIVTSGVSDGTGIELVEVYDLDVPGGCKLVNIASRAFVGTGDKLAIAGFVISGSAPRKLLIRGSGPALAALGVSGALADPRITVFNHAQAKVAENDNWGSAGDAAAIAGAASQVGAFSVASGSKDAALLITLNPGAYTVTLAGANSEQTGIGLIEVYEAP